MGSIDEELQAALEEHQAGRLPGAQQRLQQVLLHDPENPDALRLTGLIHRQTGDVESAVRFLQRAIAACDDEPALHHDLGDTHQVRGDFDAAAAAYGAALAIDADFFPSLNNLAMVLDRKGQSAEAIEAFERVLALQSDYVPAMVNLAKALTPTQPQRSLKLLRRAEQLAPAEPTVHNNLGAALEHLGQFEDAVECYRRAAAISPDQRDVHDNLVTVLWRLGRHDEALAEWDEVLRIAPGDPKARLSRATTRLVMGDFARGWEEFECRWKLPERAPDLRSFSQPTWDGSDPRGKTILAWCEQGLGDTIHFCRYVPLIAERGARVIVEVQPELVRLLRGLDGAAAVVARGQPLPAFDEHIALLSLPRVFETRLETIPAKVPYLQAEPELVTKWAGRLRDVRGRKIAIVWGGAAHNPNDKHRSCKLENLAPLAGVEGVSLISLQKGAAAAATRTAPFLLLDLADELTDFSETAAALANIDLLITVDTSVAHLAGAMGKRVWMLTQFSPDYRWLQGRNDSPWYPTLRLYRQSTPGDWTSVVDRMAKDLRKTAG